MPHGDDPSLFKLFNEIGIIAQLSSRLFESVMPDGMTLAQFSVLNHFVRLGGERSPAALADAFQVTRGTMTSTLQKLEAKGLIAISQDATDGRSKRVAITPIGRTMRDTCIQSLLPRLKWLEGQIDTSSAVRILPELQTLRRVLDAGRDPNSTPKA